MTWENKNTYEGQCKKYGIACRKENCPKETRKIKVLAVRQPWASLIVEGFKTIEVRSRPTNIRERVAIYASKTPATNCEYISALIWELQNKYKRTLPSKYFVPYNYKHFPSGQIIGTVEIESCEKLGDVDFSNEESGKYRSFAPGIIRGKSYFWHLKNPTKFTEPVPYKPPRGAVVWSNFELPEVE